MLKKNAINMMQLLLVLEIHLKMILSKMLLNLVGIFINYKKIYKLILHIKGEFGLDLKENLDIVNLNGQIILQV